MPATRLLNNYPQVGTSSEPWKPLPGRELARDVAGGPWKLLSECLRLVRAVLLLGGDSAKRYDAGSSNDNPDSFEPGDADVPARELQTRPVALHRIAPVSALRAGK